MQMEVRKAPFHTVRDFLKEYLMIVVGILTALGLEHLAEARHHRQAAAVSRGQVLNEIRLNLEETRVCLAKNGARLGKLDQLGKVAQGDMDAGRPLSVTQMELDQASTTVNELFGYTVPTIRKGAWSLALANQSAAYLEGGTFIRFSFVYSMQEDAKRFLDSLNSGEGINGLAGMKASDFLQRIRQGAGALHGVQMDLLQLESAYATALKEESQP